MWAKAIKLGSWEGNVDLHELLKHEYKEKKNLGKVAHGAPLSTRSDRGSVMGIFRIWAKTLLKLKVPFLANDILLKRPLEDIKQF